ncbi:MAG: lipopolysaccharide heptosyltransferase II [Syntrophales bacterium]
MNILIIKLSAIGDVVHTLPSLALLRKLYPNTHITWVIEEAASYLIFGHPDLDQVIISRRKAWIEDLKRGKIWPVAREVHSFFKALRSQSYDMVIDFHGLFKSAVMVAISGGKRKIGYDSLQEMSGLFYNERIPEDMGKHAVDRYMDFIRYLDRKDGLGNNMPVLFHIPIQETNHRRVEALLAEHGLDIHKSFVAVNPLALWETKLWSDEKFAELGDRIVNELNIPVVFTGSQSAYTDGIGRRMHRPSIHLGGKTSLKDLAALYGKASLLVTTDSGPMHIAAAVGTPVVALFGPTDPVRTGPYGEKHIVIRKDLACSPCFKKDCPTRQCLEEVEVEDVFAAVKHILVA